MKRIFTFSLLMLAFAMNAVAWEPVIKETHWFGMHEYYGNAPVYVMPVDEYLQYASFEKKDPWTVNYYNFYSEGLGKLGELNIEIGNEGADEHKKFVPTTDDLLHKPDGYGIGLEARWQNSYVSYSQKTSQQLSAGTYRLTYDVENVNTTTAALDQETNTPSYESLFFVQIEGGSKIVDNNTEWMYQHTGWTQHTIEFTLNSAAYVTVSMGYKLNSNTWHWNTPALFVCNLGLDRVLSSGERDPRITYKNENNYQYIESIEVVRGWTGHYPAQHPKTSFYSWFDHSKLRFSVNRPELWHLGTNGNASYNGLGLKNVSSGATNFVIHDLEQGDQFNIEYYRVPNPTTAPFLVSGKIEGLSETVFNGNDIQTKGSDIYGAIDNKLKYYTMTASGNVEINIPSGTVIRSVTIIHNNYKKATYSIEQVRDNDNNIGYKYTLTGAGVLEDKRGAVPYITMRFGADNDMTFVRDLGDNKYAAASIIDETNDFNPTTARAQHAFRDLTEAEAKDHFAGKEWTIFSADLKNNNTEDDFSTILPNYGSYYYFFPEVDGKLSLKFYCEGKEEHMPFWFKSKDGVVKDEYKAGQNTDGSNYYEINNIAVEKGGVYYLCSNPTIVQHEHPIVRLISYEFIPTFRVDPLYDVVTNGTQNYSNVVKIKGVTIDKFTNGFDGSGDVKDVEVTEEDGKKIAVLDNTSEMMLNGERAPRIKFLGNVKTATVQLTQATGSDDIYLEILNIRYKDGADINQGGAIVVNLDCPAGEAGFVLTVAYDAADAKWDADGTLRVKATEDGTQVKHWDFYSGKGEKDELGTGQGWDLGKYGSTALATDKDLWTTAPDSWKAKSKLFKEVNKHGGLTADWVDTYVNLTDGKNERFFKSVYDMEGDNADMIHETAGLVFHTHANQLGIMNENDAPTGSFQDRYIGLMKGSKFTIPFLDAGDRIVMKMGTYNNEDVTLNITGANDAINTGISSDYIIGGSIPVSDDVTGADDKYYPRGEYHFVAKGGDATFEVTSGQMLKIYSIDIYKNNEILTENQLVGDLTEVTFTDDDAANATKTIDAHVRYHGYQETSKFDNVDQLRGNISYTKNDFTVTTSTDEPYCTISTTVNNGDFGSFRAKMEVLTKDDDNTYVTDYVPGSLAVDYLKKVKDGYPYTWDFTDLLQIKNTSDTYIDNSISTERDATSLLPDYKGWKDVGGTHSLRNAPENASGVLFANGGQLYGAALPKSDGMFKEIAGIGFKRSTETPEEAKLLNESLGIKSGAIELNSGKDGVFYKLVIPKVDKDAAIYVRATPVKNATLIAKYSTDGTTGNTFSGDNAKTITADDGDKIYVVRNTAEQDVELWLDGMSIKKIAVATDEKTVNDEGWNTESRDHAIDPSLLPYMTGMDFRTYAVFKKEDDEAPISDEKLITLTRIDGVSKGDDVTDTGNAKIIGAAVDDSPNACIIRKVDSRDLFEKTVDGKIVKYFHLFAPDMHDGTSVMTNNLLKAQLTPTSETGVVPRTEDGSYNYAFTNKFKYVDGDGKQLEGREGVYTGKQAFYLIMASGAASSGNQAYLSINSKVPAARLALFIEGEKGDSEATGIATVEDNSVGGENARFYNLSGQQLSGKPNRSGLYIVNGKKVSIKNK